MRRLAPFGVAGSVTVGLVGVLVAPVSAAVPFDQQAQTVDELLALGRPVVLAHTGGEGVFPGSTMYAFNESAAAGVDMLDLNVVLSGDGVLVVQHDDTTDRTTNGSGAVADMTYDELFAFDDAFWFTPECTCRGLADDSYVWRGVRTGDVPPPDGYTADDFAIPRFQDVLDAFGQLPLNIEIKGSGESAVAAAEVLAAELTAADRLDDVVVTSFDDAVVTAFTALAPGVEVTPGLAASTAWVLDGQPLPAGQRILQLPPEYGGGEVLTDDVIERSHGAGYVIWVWTDDPAWENATGYGQLLDRGLDGLNIDDPALGVAATGAHQLAR